MKESVSNRIDPHARSAPREPTSMWKLGALRVRPPAHDDPPGRPPGQRSRTRRRRSVRPGVDRLEGRALLSLAEIGPPTGPVIRRPWIERAGGDLQDWRADLRRRLLAGREQAADPPANDPGGNPPTGRWTPRPRPAARGLADGVSLPSVFGDHMVLQRGDGTTIFGDAETDGLLAVLIQGRVYRTRAEGGRWEVTTRNLRPASSIRVVIRGANTVILNDVAIGEVWLLGGQSNMVLPVGALPDARAILAGADDPNVRLFDVPRSVDSDAPRSDLPGAGWAASDADSARGFSAVGLAFGQELSRALGVPVGLINASYGSSTTESWISPESIAAHPEMAEELDSLHSAEDEYRFLKPSVLYDNMIAPLSGLRLAGVVWYQGESQVYRPGDYPELLTTLVDDWRDLFRRDDLPFILVQIAPYRYPGRDHAATIRESQRRLASRLPDAGLVTTIDLGDPDNLHPTRKWAVGARAALVARRLVYGEDVVASGPSPREARPDGPGRVVVAFDSADGGLVARGGVPEHFELAGPDGVFHPARAEIDGTTLVVSSADVADPSYVRYAWSDAPYASLFNRRGLPASPFVVAVDRSVTAGSPGP